MEQWKKALLGGTALAALLGPVAEAQQAPGIYVTNSAFRPDAASFYAGQAAARQ